MRLHSIGAAAACALAAVLAATAPAAASVPHTVAPGETLWSIAATDGVDPVALAAANGVSPDAHVVLGTTLQIPDAGSPPSAPSGASTPATAAGTSGTSGASGASGAYTVQPGDTLSGLAARTGTTASRLAARNGLDPSAPLRSGSVIEVAGAGAPSGAAPVSAAPVSGGGPQPTEVRLSGTEIGQIAAEYGVPPALAEAIAYEESGFNNALTSPDDARGVMQLLPGTWDYVQQQLGVGPLDAGSAQDNVRAGVSYLGHLLRETGGDASTAIASYYQGLASVRDHGFNADTQQYVANVLALEQRFGG